MKSMIKALGIIVIVSIIGFSFTACSDDSGPSQPKFSVSGKFNNKGSEAKFTLVDNAYAGRAARSAAGVLDISGELEDGDFLFRLNGTYNENTGDYVVSAAASFIRYTINGNSQGSAFATLSVLDDDGIWHTFIVNVEIVESVIINSINEAQAATGGIPSWARGSWNQYWDDPDSDYISDRTLSISQWNYTIDTTETVNPEDGTGWTSRSKKYNVLKSIRLSDDVYDIIFTYPIYQATETQAKAAGNAFLKENNLSATVNVSDGVTWFDGDWENDREKLLRYYIDEYQNRYLIKTLNEEQLEEIRTTWFYRARFRREDNGNALKMNDFMNKARDEYIDIPNNGWQPSGNSTILADVEALSAPVDAIVHEKKDTNDPEKTGDLHYWGGWYTRP